MDAILADPMHIRPSYAPLIVQHSDGVGTQLNADYILWFLLDY